MNKEYAYSLVRTDFSNGLTVKQLKEIVKDWPDGPEDDLCTIWLENKDGTSDEIVEVCSLNLRTDGTNFVVTSDIILTGRKR